MKQNHFIHYSEDIISGVIEEKTHPKGNKYKERTYAKFVKGYEPCKQCGKHPAFKFDSAKPNQVEVIVCEHITKKAEKV